ncbi:Pol protein [Phytophthora palmivora]|uniref:Pol protein n=1 Tax=Phytophthora palmivora TaxID=4796 RepID=A0A2P4Y9A0_9STRA|nr:Pol protein [Phytophthora palmivora]
MYPLEEMCSSHIADPPDASMGTLTFWGILFQLLGTRLTVSTAVYPQTNGQTEHVNRVLVDTLWGFCAEAPRSWSDQLPMVEFTLNNGARKAFFPGREYRARAYKRQLSSFLDDRLTLISQVRDTTVSVQDRQKEYSDKNGRGNFSVFKKGEFVLLDTKNLPLKVVSSVESNMMKHHFIRPFAVLARHGAAYTIDLPKSMATHTTFFVGRLMRYHGPLGPSPRTEEDQVRARLFESRLSPLDNRSSRAGACE